MRGYEERKDDIRAELKEISSFNEDHLRWMLEVVDRESAHEPCNENLDQLCKIYSELLTETENEL